MNIIVPISGSCMLPESAPASIMGPAGWEEIPCWALYMEEKLRPWRRWRIGKHAGRMPGMGKR